MKNFEFKPIYLLYLAGGFFAYKIITGFSQAVGITDSPEEKKEQKNLSDPWLTDAPFLDWKKRTGFKIPSQIVNFVIPGLVNKIHDAKGFFNDDENAVYDFFRELQSKRQVSATAYYFKKEFGQSLTSYLSGFMSAAEIQKVSDLIKNKPKDVTGFYTTSK